MKLADITGVYRDKNQIYTENQTKGIKVYNARLLKHKNKEYRSWNSYRSKFAAAILNGFNFKIKKDLDL